MASRARLFIAQMADWLEAPGSARINSPGQTESCWTWRMARML
jgi:4-alpha-glucanotransferase